MRAALIGLAIAAAIVSAGSAALIILPAPSKTLALAAIVASERSLLVAATGVGAALLAALAARRGARVTPAVVVALAGAAVGVALLPPMAAWRIARARNIRLEVGRYLRARIDSEGPGAPDRTVEYAAGRKLDVYAPPPSPANAGQRSRPIIVVHGGFWAAGERGEATLASRRLAARGFTVFDVDYRLAPQPNWREAIGDVKCAIAWVKHHATTSDWNVDASKLTLLGRSAGGHLALLAAYTPDDATLPPSCPPGDGDLHVEAVVALYAPTDLVLGYERPSNPRVADSRARQRAFLGGPPETVPELYWALSPVSRVQASAPRTLLVQGGRDQFVEPRHMFTLAHKLRNSAIPHATLYIPYAQHAFDFVVGGFSSQLFEAALLQFLDGPERQAPPGG